MATRPRKQTESEIYHVIQRGTGQVDIFEDDYDRTMFANMLAKSLQNNDLTAYAWCFMSNHVHLLLRGNIEKISECMRVACSQYAIKFNARHGRYGTLFQGRFTSVAVENERQFLTVMCYIHRNPVEGGLQTNCDGYKWSSYGQYVAGNGSRRAKAPAIAVETGLVFTMVGNEEGFIRLHSDGGNAGNADIRACGPCSEDESRGLATDALGGVPVDSVGRLKREERNRMLRVLKNAGFSVRLLQRLTGLGYTIVRNA